MTKPLTAITSAILLFASACCTPTAEPVARTAEPSAAPPPATPNPQPAPVAPMDEQNGDACRAPAAAPVTAAANAPDASVPFDVGNGSFALGPPDGFRGDVVICGKVKELRPESEATLVVLDVDPSAKASTFSVSMPKNIPLPFSVGAVIRVGLRVRSIQIHQIIEVVVTDAEGKLLVGHSADGNAAFAPGWTVKVGGVRSSQPANTPGGAERQEMSLELAHLDRTASVASNQWRKLSASDGNYAVSGTAVQWTAGTRPPDASNWSAFTIIRLP